MGSRAVTLLNSTFHAAKQRNFIILVSCCFTFSILGAL